MTAVLLWSNRGSGHRFSGSTIAGVNAWSLKHLGRDLLHLSQALAVRFAGVRLILRIISGERLLVRERLFQAGLHIATVAFRLDPLRRRGPHGSEYRRDQAHSPECSDGDARLRHGANQPGSRFDPWRICLGHLRLSAGVRCGMG
jgi:hypothetical protein